MHNHVSSFIYKAASKFRNPSLEKIFQEFKDSEKADRVLLEARQLDKLKSFLCFTNKHSPFYRKLFSEVGFNPDMLQSLDDLKVIPAADKTMLIQNNAAVHSNYSFKNVRTAITSGTSGQALSFKRNEEWDSANRAGVMRGYSWYGVKVSDKNGYFWGYNIDSNASRKIRLLDAAQNRFRLFQYSDEEISEFCETMKDASYLSGYSSMIYKIAKEVNKRGLKFSNIKMVKGTSEMILPKYQDEVKQAFGLKMISEYGAAETGLIAFECPHGKSHINTDAVVVETDENGEALITNLYSHSFPIIRYRLGDILNLSDKHCTCGMQHPLIEDIVGRKGANIVGVVQEYPSFTFYYVFKNLALEDGISLNYKAYQQQIGEVVIQIEGNKNDSIVSLVEKYLDIYFKQDVNFMIDFVPNFSSEKKKQQSFTSYL